MCLSYNILSKLEKDYHTVLFTSQFLCLCILALYWCLHAGRLKANICIVYGFCTGICMYFQRCTTVFNGPLQCWECIFCHMQRVGHCLDMLMSSFPIISHMPSGLLNPINAEMQVGVITCCCMQTRELYCMLQCRWTDDGGRRPATALCPVKGASIDKWKQHFCIILRNSADMRSSGLSAF